MKKRITGIILAVLMLFSILPVSAFAAFKTKVTITQQPVSVTVRPGESASFTISANCSNSREYMYYLWFDSDKIPVSTLESIVNDSESFGSASAYSIALKHFTDIKALVDANPDFYSAVYESDITPNQPSSTITINNADKTKHIQCLVIVNNEDDMQSLFDTFANLNIDDASAVLKALGALSLKITGYALSNVVTLTVDPNAPCSQHSFVSDGGKAASCTEPGYENKRCTVCGYQTSEPIAPLGHSFGDWVVNRDSTCTIAGQRTRMCSVCFETETEVIAIKPHSYVPDTVAPTCTEGGYTTYTCSGCDASYVGDETEALSHDFVNGVCSRCGLVKELTAPVVTGGNRASDGKNTLKWEAVPGAVKYQVYRATSKTGSPKLMSTVTGTTYTNTNSQAGSTYYYKVRAVADDGTKGPFSAIVTRTCDIAQPVVTGGNNSSTGKNTLKWAKIDGAAKYEVYRATSKTGSYTKMSTVTGTTYTNTSSKAGTTYYYKVKAISSVKTAADSAYSEIVTRTCDCAKPVVTATNVASTGKVKLTWAAVDGATGYEIYRATSKTGEYTKLTTTTKTSLINSSVKAGTTYYYKIKALGSKSAADSAFSAVVSRTCDLPQPSVTIKLKSGDPQLTWAKVDGASKYEVYRATSKTGSYSKMITTSSTSYTNTSAKAGTTYYYKVVAVSSKTTAANSAYSPIVSIKAK